jgi:hypothetical protein
MTIEANSCNVVAFRYNQHGENSATYMKLPGDWDTMTPLGQLGCSAEQKQCANWQCWIRHNDTAHAGSNGELCGGIGCPSAPNPQPARCASNLSWYRHGRCAIEQSSSKSILVRYTFSSHPLKIASQSSMADDRKRHKIIDRSLLDHPG